jgi:tetratricopeptide (TPR) repeat protein
MTPPAAAPHVAWTRRAEARLQRELGGAAPAVAAKMRELSARLADTFPAAAHVVVLDLYLGFRRRADEFILPVDVRTPAGAGGSIVKLAGHPRLRLEWDAWDECRPSAGASNLVFMGLTPHPHPDRLTALVYQDAREHVGDEAVSLEDAVVRAVRFDSPAVESVIGAVDHLLGQLRRVLYDRARAEPPAGPAVLLNPVRRDGNRRLPLADVLARWDDSRLALDTRMQATAASSVRPDGFIDPVDYFRYLGERQVAHAAAGGGPADRVVPAVVRGPAHGDLHGRNVLVGANADRDRVDHPAVFDYEGMGADNLVGWDFVKLETELKVRALRHLLPGGGVRAFAAAAIGFERDLADRTRECAAGRRPWPDGPGDATPAARLAALVLAVRRHAAEVLGPHHPGRGWLREYYFLLGCYGLYNARFEAHGGRELAAAFVSAGVAADQCRQLSPPAEPGEPGHPSYREPLAEARVLSRRAGEGDLARAEGLLDDLAKRHPTALHVWFERAFNLVQQGRRGPALDLLADADARFGGHLDEDTLCLWGRCHKDPGDAHLARGLAEPVPADRRVALEEADGEYATAADKYRRAFELAGDPFPGTNLATLAFVRAALAHQLGRGAEAARLRAEADRQAADLLAGADRWRRRQPDDEVWHRAARGEASALRGLWDDAVAEYRAALKLAAGDRAAFYAESMGRQLARVVGWYRLAGRPVARDLAADLPAFARYLAEEAR